MYQAIILKTNETKVEIIVSSREDICKEIGGSFEELGNRILISLNQGGNLSVNEWFSKDNIETRILKKMYPKLLKVKGDVAILLGFDSEELKKVEQRIFFMDL